MSPHASGHMGIVHWYVQILGCLVLTYLGVSVSKFLIGMLFCGNRRHGEVVRSFSAGLQPLAVGCLELQQRSVEDPHHVSHSGTSINRSYIFKYKGRWRRWGAAEVGLRVERKCITI